ncbi:MAG: lasso RiPP family leader peptide-containing protein [Paucibacter sp.]|nr:lasso RiPP family leader peptide-containing protein [Roseateles sp.]
MNEKSQSELEPQIVELGDAKELTKGFPDIAYAEDNPTVQGRLEP